MTCAKRAAVAAERPRHYYYLPCHTHDTFSLPGWEMREEKEAGHHYADAEFIFASIHATSHFVIHIRHAFLPLLTYATIRYCRHSEIAIYYIIGFRQRRALRRHDGFVIFAADWLPLEALEIHAKKTYTRPLLLLLLVMSAKHHSPPHYATT